MTALHYAAGCNHSKVVRILLENGCDSNIKDKVRHVVELLANDENSNFICQWSVKSSWMLHGWSFVWSNNYAVLW